MNRIVRPRLTCTCCERFVQAPLPSRPIERGRPGPGLLAHVLVSKYADHLPLYRQSQIFEREGLDLDRSTLADWVGKTTALLEPLADAVGRHVLSAEAIFADDTPVSMLAPGTGKTQTARLWTYARDERPWGSDAPPAAWYRFSGDRKGQHPKDHTGPASAAGCMPTAMRGSRISIGPERSARSPAWPMSGASSSTSTDRKVPDRRRGHQPDRPALRCRERGQRLAARCPGRTSQKHTRPGLRRSGGLVGHATDHDLGQIPARGSHPLCLARMERLRPYLDHGILELDNNTPNAACAPSPSDGRTTSSSAPKQAARPRRNRLYPDRNGQAQRRRSSGLAGRHPRPNPGLQDHKSRRPAPMALKRIAVRPDGFVP